MSSASRVRARLTRLLTVPTAQPQISAACSYEKPDAPDEQQRLALFVRAGE